MKVQVLKNIASASEAVVEKNQQILQKNRITAINIMSSPGSGKTSLIMTTIEKLRGKIKLGVIEGDIASSVDADRIGKTGIPVVQINTGGDCSLGAHMIDPALVKLPLKEINLLIIENVGNLICPAESYLGEHKKVVIASLPEGDDKPLKYPVIFSRADAVVINKMDLEPYMDFDLKKFRKVVKGLNPDVKIFEVSCKTHTGIAAWTKWLTGLVEK
jgi:hydrogenase nickel incorporation protein HypB